MGNRINSDAAAKPLYQNTLRMSSFFPQIHQIVIKGYMSNKLITNQTNLSRSIGAKMSEVYGIGVISYTRDITNPLQCPPDLGGHEK
jgi:hypothetical protein